MKKLLVVIMSLFLFNHISFADENDSKFINACREKYYPLEEKVQNYETGVDMTEEDITKELNERKSYCINQIGNFYNDETIKVNVKFAIENNDYRRYLQLLLKYKEQNQKFKKAADENNKKAVLANEYKEKMRQQLGNKINSLPKEKLQEINKKLNTLYLSYEANVKINEIKKEKILFQLYGLMNLINERLYNIDNSLDDLLKVQ